MTATVTRTTQTDIFPLQNSLNFMFFRVAAISFTYFLVEAELPKGHENWLCPEDEGMRKGWAG